MSTSYITSAPCGIFRRARIFLYSAQKEKRNAVTDQDRYCKGGKPDEDLCPPLTCLTHQHKGQDKAHAADRTADRAAHDGKDLDERHDIPPNKIEQERQRREHIFIPLCGRRELMLFAVNIQSRAAQKVARHLRRLSILQYKLIFADKDKNKTLNKWKLAASLLGLEE